MDRIYIYYEAFSEKKNLKSAISEVYEKAINEIERMGFNLETQYQYSDDDIEKLRNVCKKMIKGPKNPSLKENNEKITTGKLYNYRKIKSVTGMYLFSKSYYYMLIIL